MWQPLEGVKSSSLLLRNSPKWANGPGTFLFWGPLRKTAHTEKSSCQEMLSLFAVHRESQGPVTSMKSHCSCPRSIRSKTTVSENAATLPKLNRQLQMLQIGCTDIPAQRAWALSPIPEALCATFLVVLLLLPHPAVQPWGMLLHWEQHISFSWAPTSFITTFLVTHLWYIISTASSHCYF